MNAIELINTLSNGTQVLLVDKGEKELISPSSVKWFKKFYNNKYQYEATHYLNMKVVKHYTDEFGRLVIMLNYGLTKKQQEAADRKFRKEHDGKSREEVYKTNSKRALTRFAAVAAWMASISGNDKYM